MRKHRYGILIGFIGLLMLATLLVGPASATVVWQDDFNDGNYDGWTKHDPDVPAYGFDYVVTDGAVYSDSDGTDAWEWLSHPSTGTEGQWSFDFFQPDLEGEVAFIVMANGTWADMLGWGIHILCFEDSNPAIYITEWDGQFFSGSHLVFYLHDSQINGTWVHFDVTCDASGEMNVFLEGEHILQYSGITYESSEIFIFSVGEYVVGYWDGFGMDNVVYNDEISITTESTTTTTTTTTDDTTPPPAPIDMMTMLLIAGGGIAVVVVIVVVLKMRS